MVYEYLLNNENSGVLNTQKFALSAMFPEDFSKQI